MKRFQAPISEIRALAIPPQVNKLKFFITLQNYSGLKTKTRAGHHIDFHFPTNWKYSSPFIQSTATLAPRFTKQSNHGHFWPIYLGC